MTLQPIQTSQPNIQNLRLEKVQPKEVGIINQAEKILPSIEPGLGGQIDIYI